MKLEAYLFFDNQAGVAFDFYAKCLGGKIAMKVTYGEMPGTEQMPPEVKKQIAHVRLEAGGAVLMGSDFCSPTPEPYPGIHGCAVCLGVEQPGEAERLFAALSQGGKIEMPIGETSWSQRFGMFVDRYGVHWMVNCNRPQ
jgi:PhnB protein